MYNTALKKTLAASVVKRDGKIVTAF